MSDKDHLNKIPDLVLHDNCTTTAHVQSPIGIEAVVTTEALTQPWWTSRTIWGAIVVIVAQIGLMFDVKIDTNSMIESVLAFVTLVGAIVTWWGRVYARRPISLTKILPGIELL